MRAALAWLVLIVLIAAGFLYTRDYVRRHPQDVTWTELSLGDPVGMFTLRKLVALRGEPAVCRGLLDDYGGGTPAPPRRDADNCGYADGIRLADDGRNVGFLPAGVVTSCPVAAAFLLYEREVLQPAAIRHFGAKVTAVDHAGSYSCRRLYGRSEGAFSEHSTANALDIIGFRLTDGSRVSVLQDWRSAGAKAAFLRDARDGACDLFATVLSPDYNAAHADHLHLGQAKRGQAGWSLCR